jgi:MYXO-CTERM domain-containing protein
MTRRGATAIGLLLATFAVARPASAYVRAVADYTGLPVYWSSPCALVTIYLNGFTELTSDDVAKSIAGAAQAWSPDTVTCPGSTSDAGSAGPSFEIITQFSTGGPIPNVGGTAGSDGKNSLIFRTTEWDYDPSAIALTTRNTDPSGRIFDADIEVNALPSYQNGYVWANLDPGAPPASGGVTRMDLQTAITHEFGHFLGMAHTCFNPALDPPPRPVDDQGQPVPDCIQGADIPEAQSVMWFLVEPDSSNKRVLTDDDVRGVCAIYPPTATPATCKVNLPNDGCGCRAGGGGPAATSALLLALGSLAVARRRRRAEAGSRSIRTSRTDGSPIVGLDGTSSCCSAARIRGADTRMRQAPGASLSRRKVPVPWVSARAVAPSGPIASMRACNASTPVARARTSPVTPPGTGTTIDARSPGVAGAVMRG